jgi:hypothetical protein
LANQKGPLDLLRSRHGLPSPGLDLPEPFASLGDNRVNIPKLVDLVRAGGVTPFVGAGMSAGFGFPDWRTFLTSLASDEGQRKRIAARLDKGEYEEAAQSLLRSRGSNAFQDALEHTFGNAALRVVPPDSALHRLALLVSGPVLTTNFDRVLETVFASAGRRFPEEKVIPGARVDAVRKVINERLHALIKLHGDVGDRTERVLTLKEYETKYGRAPLRPLLEAAMIRPLLFLGCSLGNDRPVRTLKSLVARYKRNEGEGMLDHYAILEYPASDSERRKRLAALKLMAVKPIWFPTREFPRIAELLQIVADRAGARPSAAAQRRIFPELTLGLDTASGLTSVEQFLSLYLGSPGGEPPPLVGRADKLAALDAWLAEPGAPYALVVAPAGRGKSALVTRWAHAVATSGRAQVAFAPASLRFETASLAPFMRILGQRLRFLRERRLAAPVDARDWVVSIEEELRIDSPTKPLLVVLDGMDEASQWSIGSDLRVPPAPGAGVKVLVTARQLADRDAARWRRVLEWGPTTRTIPLPLLRPMQLEAVLVAWKIVPPPSVTARKAIDELWALTKGDPLLLSLYCGGLARGEISFNRLSRIAPGLEGYFEEWWRDQRRADSARALDKPSVIQTLCALATSLGPITHRDLTALLAPKPGRQKIERALGVLHRFVIGAGAPGKIAYSFSHPMLQDFFRDRYVSSQKSWRERYIARGAALFDELTTSAEVPDDFSPYFLQHYGEHLERAGRPLEQIAGLLHEVWLGAWRKSEETEWGFLGDVDRVQRLSAAADQDALAASAQAPHLHTEIACFLVRASLVSVNLGAPPELLAALLDKGVWDTHRALVDARRAPLPLQRALALVVIGRRIEPAESRPFLEEAEALGSWHGVLPQMLSAAWLALGDAGQAERAQRQASDRSWRRDFLVAEAQRLVAALDVAALVSSTEGLEPGGTCDVLLAFADRAQESLRAALLVEARKAADRLSDDSKAVALLRLARQDPLQRARLIEEALAIAEDVAGWGMGDTLVPAILDALPPDIDGAELSRADAVVEALRRTNPHDPGLAEAALVRFQPAASQRAARRAVLAGLLDRGNLHTESQLLFRRWSADVEQEEAADLLKGLLPQRADLYMAPLLLALAGRVSGGAFAGTLRDLLLAVVRNDGGSEHDFATIVRSLPDERWSDVLDALGEIAERDDPTLTKSVGVSAQGQLREPMSGDERRQALCPLLRLGGPHMAAEVLPRAVDFARRAGGTEGWAVLSALIPRLSGELALDVIREALAFRPFLDRGGVVALLRALPSGLPAALQAAASRSAASAYGEERTLATAAVASKLDAEALETLRLAVREVHDDHQRASCVAKLGRFATPRGASRFLRRLVEAGFGSDAIGLVDRIDAGDLSASLALQSKLSYPEHQARYIAALAPRLERDDLLAALQSLRKVEINWRILEKRDDYLSPLAVRAVQLGLTPQALAAVKQWPDKAGRVRALSAIAGLLPLAMFEPLQTIARAVDGRYWGPAALCALAPLAPDPAELRAEVLRSEGKDPALLVLEADWKDQYMSEDLWMRALAGPLSPFEGDADQLGRALRRAPPLLHDLAVARLLERCEAEAAEKSYKIVYLLQMLAERAARSHRDRVAALARRVRDVHEWMRIVSPLLEHAPPGRRLELAAAARFEKKGRADDSVNINDVVAARFGTDDQRYELLVRLVAMPPPAWILDYLVPLLLEMPADRCYRLCVQILTARVSRGRRDLLDALETLAPVVARLESGEGVDAIIQAIDDFGAWWP